MRNCYSFWWKLKQQHSWHVWDYVWKRRHWSCSSQVGIHKKICVIDIEGNKDPKDQLVLINPKITEKSGETGIDEGCLSVPGLRAHVDRALKIKVTAQNLKGEEFTIDAEELLAICIQHELDHLSFGQ